MSIQRPGDGADAVQITFGGNLTKTFTSYTVRKSILTQPSQFNVRLGYGEIKRFLGNTAKSNSVKDIIAAVPPNTPFQLFVNNAIQQTGFTDGYDASGFATELEIHGRDNLKFIHDAYLRADISFKNDTYTALTKKVFEQLGITERLASSDQANLKLTTGVNINNFVAPATEDQIEPLTDQPGNVVVKRSIVAKLGETYFHFLQRQYRRAGIFLWAGGDGSYILSEPTTQQSPSYRIVRQRGSFRNAVNATSARHKNDTTRRYTSAQVYGRGGGRKFGRAKAFATFVDDEMINLLGGDVKPITYRDVNVYTHAQGEFYARRKLAEFNRSAWNLEYTVSGHTAPNIITGLTSTWCPNTLVEVIDDEYGLKDIYYLEQVEFTRPPTQTKLTLMRLKDLVFASDEGEG